MYSVSVDNICILVHVIIMEHELVHKRPTLLISLKTDIWHSFT